jgi:hypothetical protein
MTVDSIGVKAKVEKLAKTGRDRLRVDARLEGRFAGVHGVALFR